MITGKALRARGMERCSDGEMERWGVGWKEGWRGGGMKAVRKDGGMQGRREVETVASILSLDVSHLLPLRKVSPI